MKTINNNKVNLNYKHIQYFISKYKWKGKLS